MKAKVNINLNVGESVKIELNSIVDVVIECNADGYVVHTIACGKDCAVSVSYDELVGCIDKIFDSETLD